MEISVLIDKEIKEHPETEWLRSVAERVLITQGVSPDAELGLVITGQQRVQELNRTYRGKDAPTDVLSFCMATAEDGISSFVAPPDEVLHLGEVIISYPQAEIQAGEHGHSAKKEVTILLIHGVLHLVGYDHDQPERQKKMQAREKAILKLVSEGLD